LHLLKPVDPETYRGLAALLKTSAGLINHSRSLAAQYRQTATEVMFRTLEMANLYLDAAAIAANREDNSVVSATGSYDRLVAWLDGGACIDDRAAEFVNGLRTLNERLKVMAKPHDAIERREPPRIEIRRQNSQ
jgi:hypothetical protein